MLVIGVGGSSETYDESAAAFQVVSWNVNELSSDIIYVLGTDGNLWLETGPKKDGQTVQVDADVVAFQTETVYVLDTNGVPH